MEEMLTTSVWVILLRKSNCKRSRRKWESSIKKVLTDTTCGRVYCIELLQDWDILCVCGVGPFVDMKLFIG